MRGSNQRLDYVGITWDPDDWHLGLIGALGDILGVSVEQVVVKQHHINALSPEHQQGFVDPRNTDDLVVLVECFRKNVADRGLVFDNQHTRTEPHDD